MTDPTDVLLTVDLEFTSAGYLDDPQTNRPIGSPSVDLLVDGEPNGLPLMLDILGRAGVKATFFVETAQSLYFGADEMGGHVAALLDQGHDVQLHIHPQWLYCQLLRDGDAESAKRMTDSMALLDEDSARTLIDHGIRTLKNWGAPPPVALRTGNLQVSPAVYRIMADAGLRIASNVGLGVADPGEASLRHLNGRHRIHDVVEVPVFSYPALSSTPLKRTKSLTITGVSSAETRSILKRARRGGVAEVVLLTHAHEMIKRDSAYYRSVKKNPLNAKRLANLCRWVGARPSEFRFSTVADCAGRWQAGPEAAGVPISVPAATSFLSLAENALNDRIGAP